MNTHCPCCGSPNVIEQQPCPYCGLVHNPKCLFSPPVLSRQQGLARASHSVSGRTGKRALSSISLFQPETTLDKEHYLLLAPQSVQQWGAEVLETRWLAQETEPGTGNQRSVTIVDVVLPTYEQCQSVSRAARRAYMGKGSSTLLHAFLEQKHCLFVFADGFMGSLQERIDRQHLLSEREAMTCLRDLARAIMQLSQLDPPVMHGWICPAHVVQRGMQWHMLPGSGLVAGEATRFADIHVPVGLGDGSFQPGRDLLSVFQTVYAGLTGLMPPPSFGNQRLPYPAPAVSASFAALLAHGLQAGFRTPSDLLIALGERIADHPQHSHPRFSGSLTPTVAIERAGEAPSMVSSSSRMVMAKEDTAARTPPGPQEREPSETRVETIGAYPLAPDARHALFWSSSILVAELLVLFFSR